MMQPDFFSRLAPLIQAHAPGKDQIATVTLHGQIEDPNSALHQIADQVFGAATKEAPNIPDWAWATVLKSHLAQYLSLDSRRSGFKWPLDGEDLASILKAWKTAESHWPVESKAVKSFDWDLLGEMLVPTPDLSFSADPQALPMVHEVCAHLLKREEPVFLAQMLGNVFWPLAEEFETRALLWSCALCEPSIHEFYLPDQSHLLPAQRKPLEDPRAQNDARLWRYLSQHEPWDLLRRAPDPALISRMRQVNTHDKMEERSRARLRS